MAKKETVPTPATPEVNVDELLPKLSNKNADYVFKLRKFLKDGGADEARETEILKEMLPSILKEQQAGKPANQVYGSPSVLATNLINAPKVEKQQPFWIETIDLGLSFMAIFAVIYGAMSFFSKNASQQASGGIFSLALMSFVAAFVFTYYNRWMAKPRGERPSIFLLIAIGMVIIVAVSFASTWVATKINSPITSSLPAVGQFILAALAYGAHFLMKRHYGLRNMFQATAAPTKRK